MSETKRQRGKTPLNGPDEVVLETAQRWGPLAGRAGRACRFRSQRLSVTAGALPVTVSGLTVAPLRRGDEGTTAAGSVTVTPRTRGGQRAALPLSLGVGESLELQLTAEGVGEPGSYRTELTCLPDDGAPLVIPVQLRLRAHRGWAVAFVLLGLLTLGLVGFLGGEAEIGDERSRVLELQRRFHEHLDRYPGQDGATVRRVEDSLGRALRILSAGRPLSLRDDRLARAEALRVQAADGFEALNAQVAGKSPGEVGWQRVDTLWSALEDRLAEARRLRPAAPDAFRGSAFAVALQRFLELHFERTVAAAVQGVEWGMEPRVAEVALLLNAGEDERVRRKAETVHRLLRRSARQLDQAVTGFHVWSNQAAVMELMQAGLAERAGEGLWPEEVRRRISGSLDEAARLLGGDGAPEDFGRAHQLLQEAEVEAAAAESETLLRQMQAALDEATAATSLEWVAATLARLPPPDEDDPEVKRDNLLILLDLWREKADTVRDAERRSALHGIIDRTEEEVRAGDWEAAAKRSEALFQRWEEHSAAVQEAAGAAVLAPYCKRQLRLLNIELAAAREQARWLAGRPGVDEIERDLERAAQWIASLRLDTGCLDAITRISGALLETGSELLALSLESLPQVDEGLREMVKGTGAAAIAEAERLLRPVRPLDVILRTPPEQRVAGRRIAVEVGHLHPIWGAGTLVEVAFGDGSPPWRGDAEQLRQRPVLEHRYASPERFVIAVRATDDESFGEATELLGEGRTAVEIAADPVSGARRLAGLFLNLRFAVALIAALLIQGWRMTSERLFGARNRDYLEAFAIGFGAHAGVDGLAALLPSLLP